MNFDFGFLNNVVIEAPKAEKAPRVTKEEKLPAGLTLRVFANGKVFPSQQLVNDFTLEYVGKESAIKPKGVDIIKSSGLAGYPMSAPQCLLFAATPKSCPKVDLFQQCGYDEAGNPKASVLTQGGGTFGIQLLSMIEEVYGITVEKGNYIDLQVLVDISPKVPEVVFIPKTVASGEKKGEPTVVRRENITIFPLVPVVATDTKEVEEDKQADTITEAEFEEENVLTVEAEEVEDTEENYM